jgi:hypothetical protein
MTDLGGGIYVSRVDSDEYEPDDEVGGFTHTLFEDGETAAGLWKIESDVNGGAQGHELPARVEIQDGPTLDLRQGDMASMPKGAVTSWHPSPDFREVWFYS